MSEKIPPFVGYGGAAVSVVSSMTLSDWGMVFGIATAVITCAVNYYFQHQRNTREKEFHVLRVKNLTTEDSSCSEGGQL